MSLAVTKRGVRFCLKVLAVERKFGSAKLAAATRGALTLAVLSALLLVGLQPAHAQTETVLYSFGSQGGDGTDPVAGLVMDKKGNFYGTTWDGGAYAVGTVFKLAPTGTETVLYSFTGTNGDGAFPPAGLIIDKKGNLYGTTYYGGANGYGTVFKLSPSKKGAWAETVLYSFTAQGNDGAYPYAGLIMDTQGNLYGTTVFGGGNNSGTVFKLTPTGSETVLYSFAAQGPDGAYPYAGVVMDKLGNLYGTTSEGGANYFPGTVFELTPTGTETVLYSFTGANGDGADPNAGLVIDKKGNLYGTTYYGGANGRGTVFKLSPSKKGAWAETVLNSFGGQAGDGAFPYAGLIMDTQGNLYGTTVHGGAYGGGTVFKMTPAGIETALYSFAGYPGDGAFPNSGVVMDKLGNLYGTTAGGGANSDGTVFKVTP